MVTAARRSTGYNVLLSARIGKPDITRRVTELVTQQGLRFQQIILKPNGTEQRSAEWKAEEFKRLLKQTGATSVVLYDDDFRNVEALAQAAVAYDVGLRVVHGSGMSSPVACTQEEYISMSPRTGRAVSPDAKGNTPMKKHVPTQFVAPAEVVAEAFGLRGGAGTVGFDYCTDTKRWVLSHSGRREVSPLSTADVYRIYRAASAYKELDATRRASVEQTEASSKRESCVASARLMRAETADPTKLQEAVKLLQSVDFGQDPTKGLPVLEKARGLVLEGGVQPTDIELAIRSWSEPNGADKAKGFIYGPSGRGSNKGALTDLAAVLEKSKTGAEN